MEEDTKVLAELLRSQVQLLLKERDERDAERARHNASPPQQQPAQQPAQQQQQPAAVQLNQQPAITVNMP